MTRQELKGDGASVNVAQHNGMKEKYRQIFYGFSGVGFKGCFIQQAVPRYPGTLSMRNHPR